MICGEYLIDELQVSIEEADEMAEKCIEACKNDFITMELIDFGSKKNKAY
jgi:hypothetical protein